VEPPVDLFVFVFEVAFVLVVVMVVVVDGVDDFGVGVAPLSTTSLFVMVEGDVVVSFVLLLIW